MTLFLWILLAVVALFLIGNFFTSVIQEKFIFRPVKLKSGFQFSFPVHFDETFLDTKQGGHINLLHFHPENQIRQRVILYYHGNAGNLIRWGAISEYFDSLGYDFISYDYRGFGKSEGKRNEHLFHSDAQLVYDWTLERYSSENMVLYGRSLGSGLVCPVAVNNKHKVLILETPFASMRQLFQSYYPFLPSRLFSFKYQFQNDDQLRELESPVLILQGICDRITPVSSNQVLKECLNHEDSQYVLMDGGRHSDLSNYELYHTSIEKFLR